MIAYIPPQITWNNIQASTGNFIASSIKVGGASEYKFRIEW